MSDPAELGDFIDHLRGVFFALRGISERLLADLGCTPAERGVLDEIDRFGPRTVPAMAQARAVSRQAMQRTIDRLIARRWVVAQPNPRHLRSPLLSVTPAGKRLIDEVRARERRLADGARLPVGADELRRTTRTLEALERYFDQLELRGARRPRGGRR